MADIDINTDSWRTHAGDTAGIGQTVEQGGSAYMAALDGNVFGVFTPLILPAYTAVSEIFAQRNTEFGQLGPPTGSVNPFIRTLTPLPARGRRCLRACHRVYVRVVRPACISSG